MMAARWRARKHHRYGSGTATWRSSECPTNEAAIRGSHGERSTAAVTAAGAGRAASCCCRVVRHAGAPKRCRACGLPCAVCVVQCVASRAWLCESCAAAMWGQPTARPFGAHETPATACRCAALLATMSLHAQAGAAHPPLAGERACSPTRQPPKSPSYDSTTQLVLCGPISLSRAQRLDAGAIIHTCVEWCAAPTTTHTRTAAPAQPTPA